MGLYRSNYVGPFLKIKEKVVQETEEVIRWVSEDGKEEFKKEYVFSPDSGAKLIKKLIKKDRNKTYNTWYDIVSYFYDKGIELDDEEFNTVSSYDTDLQKGYFILLPNTCRFNNYTHTDDDVCCEITAEDLGSTIDFSNEYKKEMRLIDEVFDEGNATVHYGVVSIYR